MVLFLDISGVLPCVLRKIHLLVARREGCLPYTFQNPLQAVLNRKEEVNENLNSHDLHWPL